MPKIVAQGRKRDIQYLYTLRRTIAYAYTLRNAIAYLNTCIPYLNTSITYLNTLTRLSAFGFRLHILIHWTDTTRLGSQSESSTRDPSAANQNQVLRHPSRQPIRIEHGKNPSTSSAYQNRVLRHPSRQPIRIEHGKNPSTSSAYQNRVLRHPSRQAIRIEYYVTRELSARVEVPSRLSARLGSL